MALVSLVFQGHNNLRYKVTFEDDTSVTITSSGAATPDLQTDTLAGPLKEISKAGADGIGTVAALALTQAQARDLLLADHTGASCGNDKVPRAKCTLTGRDNARGAVDVNVDGSHNPEITVTGIAASTYYLDVEFIGGIAQ